MSKRQQQLWQVSQRYSQDYVCAEFDEPVLSQVDHGLVDASLIFASFLLIMFERSDCLPQQQLITLLRIETDLTLSRNLFPREPVEAPD